MAGANPLYYWDTCLFLSWIKDEQRKSGEMEGVREIIDLSKRRDCRIMTSVITSVEVLQSKIPAGIDTMFLGLLKRVTRVGVDTKVAQLAHDIRDNYRQSGKKIKTPDALHLATAIIHRANEFHTFDEDDLIPLSGNVAGHRLTICKPKARNPELDLRPRQ
jgi:predicted nucleic acid-binding protein